MKQYLFTAKFTGVILFALAIKAENNFLNIFGLSNLKECEEVLLVDNEETNNDALNILRYLHCREINQPVEISRDSDLFKDSWCINPVEFHDTKKAEYTKLGHDLKPITCHKLILMSRETDNEYLKFASDRFDSVNLWKKYSNNQLLFCVSNQVSDGDKVIGLCKIEGDAELWKMFVASGNSNPLQNIAEFEQELIAAVATNLHKIFVLARVTIKGENYYLKVSTINHKKRVKAAYFESEYLYTLDLKNTVRKWQITQDKNLQELNRLNKYLFIRLIQNSFEETKQANLEQLEQKYRGRLNKESLRTVYNSLAKKDKDVLKATYKLDATVSQNSWACTIL